MLKNLTLMRHCIENKLAKKHKLHKIYHLDDLLHIDFESYQRAQFSGNVFKRKLIEFCSLCAKAYYTYDVT